MKIYTFILVFGSATIFCRGLPDNEEIKAEIRRIILCPRYGTIIDGDYFREMLQNNVEYLNAPLDNYGNTALHTAVLINDTEFVTILLNLDADVNVRNGESHTPLHLNAMNPITATDEADREYLIIRLLCAFFRSWEKVSDMISGVPEWKKANITKLLLEKNADMNAKDNKGETALHRACKINNTNVAMELVNFGADISVRNNVPDQKTALHLAAEKGYLPVVELLLNGVNGNIALKLQNHEGITPLDILLSPDHSETNRGVVIVILKVVRKLNQKYGEKALKLFSPGLWAQSQHWHRDNFENFLLNALDSYRTEHVPVSSDVEDLRCYLENEDLYYFYIILQMVYEARENNAVDTNRFEERIANAKCKFANAIRAKIFGTTYFSVLPPDFVERFAQYTNFDDKIHRMSTAAVLVQSKTRFENLILVNYIVKKHFL